MVCARYAWVLTVLLPLSAAWAQPVGMERLFTTPAERQALDQARILSLTGTPPPREFDATPTPTPSPTPSTYAPRHDLLYTLDGAVARADGSYAVWINGRSYTEATLPAHIQVLEPVAQGRVRITDPDSGRDWELRVGQTLSLVTGELREAYQRPGTAASPTPSPTPGAQERP